MKVAFSILTALLLFPLAALHAADVPKPAGSDAVAKPVTSSRSGLLLQPPVDISHFTQEDFTAFSATVGPEKIRKTWTSPVTALPPHPRKDVRGLTEDEVKEYMVRVCRLFDQGASIPVSDVGLISTQEDVVRQPMFNHVAVFSNAAAHIYLLVQRQADGKQWAYFSIVQDRTTEPPVDYYARIKGTEVEFKGTNCYRCHSSGPLAIHPARADLVSDAALAVAISKDIVDQPLSRFHFPENDPPPDYGKPLVLKACVKCHDTDGDRAPLFKVHSHPIRVLVDFGYMPPNHHLTPAELAELKSWLDH